MTGITITELRHSGGFLVSEANGERSRDQVTLLQQAAQPTPPTNETQAGTILGESTVGATAAYAANAGNTGNFTCGAIALSQGVVEGIYSIVFGSATEYEVNTPAGALVGEGKTGVAFSAGGLTFTLTAGGTAAVAGDGGTITLAADANAGLYNVLSLTALDGTQNAAAILYNTVDATGGNTNVTVISREAEVNGSELIYPAGATAQQIAATNAQLVALGIVIR